MPYLVLGVAILIGVFFAARWFASAPPAQIAKVLTWGSLIIFVPLTALLVLRGGPEFLAFLIPAALPWILRARAASRWARNWQRMSAGARGGGRGGTRGGPASRVETAFLGMELDTVTGEMSGEVLQGRFAGRRLADMTLDELVQLLGEVSADEQSAQVLMSYLDRYHGDAWREMAAAAGAGGGNGGRAAPRNGGMTREEAYEVLGLAPGASDDEIKEAHRELMTKLHPDHGGSTYLATKINQAKDLLLGHR